MTASLAACSGQPGNGDAGNLSGGAAAQAQPTATPVPALCDNPLGPVKLGATWTYSSTTNNEGPAVFTTTITDVRPNGFSAVADLGDNIRVNQDWACMQDGLTIQSLDTGSASLSLDIEGIQVDLTTSDATGLILPAHLETGATWPYGLSIDGKVKQGDSSANVQGSISTAFEDVGSEPITVPAGSFNATKIQATSTIKVTADYLILKLPITSVVTTTFWLAPGVGLVKSVESGDLMGTTLSSTTELQSYNIP